MQRVARVAVATVLTLITATLLPGVGVGATTPALADNTAPPNSDAPLALSVPGSVLAAAGPSALAAARLANSQSFNWQFADPQWASISGSSTSTPAATSTLTSAEQATWNALTKEFAAPATPAAAVSRTAIDTSTTVLLGLQLGLAIGGTGARLAGFTDDQVCSQGAALTTLASVLDNVDCNAYQNKMTAIQRDSDQVPVSSMSPITYHGITARYLFGVPWNTYPNNLLTCFSYTGQSDPGYRFTGVTVWGANNTQNFTGTNLNNDNCSQPSNLSGWWIQAPLLSYKLTFLNQATNQPSDSPVSTGTYATPHPTRTWQCVLLFSNGQGVDSQSHTFTEQDATLGAIQCPTVPAGVTVTGMVLNELAGSSTTQVMSLTTTTAYRQWIAAHPECTNGSCLTDLRKDGVSCFRQTDVHACAGWFTSSTRNSHYTCFEGTRSVALSECYVYAPTFDGTNAEDGHGYGDPTTGATQATQTTPTKRQRLSKICKSYLAQTPTSGTSTIGAVAGVSSSACDTKPIYLPGKDLMDATDHRVAAIAANPVWVHLNYESQTDKSADIIAQGGPPSNRTWYTKTTTCKTTVTSKSCDEFPNYAMLQGAQVVNWKATPLQEVTSLQYVTNPYNSNEGSKYGGFVTSCNLTSATRANPTATGSDFLEIPGIVATTTYICAGQ